MQIEIHLGSPEGFLVLSAIHSIVVSWSTITLIQRELRAFRMCSVSGHTIVLFEIYRSRSNIIEMLISAKV